MYNILSFSAWDSTVTSLDALYMDLYWILKLYTLLKYSTFYTLPDIKGFVRRLYNTNMNGNQFTYENVFRWFLSPLAKTSVTMSMYFLLGLLTLLDLLRLFCILLHKVRGLGNWDLGNGFIIITRPWGLYGLITYHRMWLRNTDLHILGRFRGTQFLLVGISCWWCMLYARGLGCYPRLGCRLRVKSLGCYPKYISCMW